jgi:hypothetical protein
MVKVHLQLKKGRAIIITTAFFSASEAMPLFS